MLVERFVRQHTRLKSTPLLPELRLHLGGDPTPLWSATQAFALKNGLLRRKSMDPPYWAYAWAGGQALARWVLDTKAVKGKAVLDVASGGGVVGVAAALAGAKKVVCADLDPMAEHVARLNARENRVQIEAVTHDATRLDTAAFDVVFAGDVFYEASMTAGLLPWLIGEASKREVIAADPGRKYAPKTHATELARYLVKTPVVLEGRPSREALVYRIE